MQKLYHNVHSQMVSVQNAGTCDLLGHPYGGNVFHKCYTQSQVPGGGGGINLYKFVLNMQNIQKKCTTIIHNFGLSGLKRKQ